MNVIKRIAFITSLFFIICISCKSSFKKSSNTYSESINQSWRSDTFFDPVWYDTIQNQKYLMLSLWLRVNPISHYSGPPYSEDYNLFTSMDDLKGAVIIPVEIYTLDIQEFLDFQVDSSVPFESLLKLKKNKAEFYVVKNKKFYYNVSMNLNHNTWEFAGFGPIFKNYADSLSMQYFVNHEKIFRVYYPRAFSGIAFTVFKKEGVLYSISNGGVKMNFYKELYDLSK